MLVKEDKGSQSQHPKFSSLVLACFCDSEEKHQTEASHELRSWQIRKQLLTLVLIKFQNKDLMGGLDHLSLVFW